MRLIDALNTHRWKRLLNERADTYGFCMNCGKLVTGELLAMMNGPGNRATDLSDVPCPGPAGSRLRRES